MPELADVTINGQPYMIAPAGYERAAENPAPVKPGRMSLSTFRLGLGWVQDDQIPEGMGGGGWAGLGVHATQGGSGLEPWPFVATNADAVLAAAVLPSLTDRAGAYALGGYVYLHIGTRLYRTVAISATSWANLTQVHNATNTITDITNSRGDILYGRGAAADILLYPPSTGTAITFRVGRKADLLLGYNGQVLAASNASGLEERLELLTVASDGVNNVDIRWLDSNIVRFGLFAGAAVIATETSLYQLAGQVIRAAGAAGLYNGEPDPLFSHGFTANTDAGDFSFLLSLTGKLYTWLAGSVMVYDPTRTGGNGWAQVGPKGQKCHGACVAAGHLVVAIETAAGQSEVWAYDGVGWWLALSDAAPKYCWPIALNGAGSYDAMVLHAGSGTYSLLRLVTRSSSLHSYPATGTWTSPLITAGNADKPKAWRAISAYFSWPDSPGNSGSADQVTITLEYSTDAGETWTTADTESVSVAHTHQLEAVITTPPVSRLLQLRVSWSSVSDWAPVLSRLAVDYVTIDNAPRRRQWKLKVTARDRQVRRDSGVLSATGREQIDALFAAWRDQTTITFRDTDYDADATQHTVRVTDITQQEPKSSDGGRWGDALLTLTLAEV